MWIFFSICAAFFSGLTTILGKVGVKDIDVTFATLIRTTIILIFCIIISFFYGSFTELNKIDNKVIIFLILSGISTCLLWLSYFKALQLGTVSKVTPIDKTSIILTLILSIIFFKESITLTKIISMILILIGTILMVSKRENKDLDNKWILYAIYTSILTSITTIVGKVGIKDIDSNLGMVIRTFIIFVIVLIIVIIRKKYKDIKKINKKVMFFLVLSGITTGLSWLSYFKALKLGETSIVFSIEKLSIVVAVLISWIFLKERINKKSILGLITIIVAELVLIFK